MSRTPLSGLVRRQWAALALGAAGYALLYALGSQIDVRGFTERQETVKRFALALPVAFLVLLGAFEWLIPHLRAKRMEECTKKPFCTLGAMALIFLSYVPMLLIEYPGSFAYDTKAQTMQIASGQYDAFQSIFHTLLIRLCLSGYGVFQSFERCAVLYSLIQMTLVSACFALICASLSRSCSRRAARLAVVFFCLFPYHMVFASNCTKDVLFSASFALMVTLAFERLRTGRLSRFHMALFVLGGTLSCLLRNNMIYAAIAWLVFLTAGGRTGRKLLVAAVGVIVLSIGASEMLIALTHAGRGNLREMLSVPAQQLARVYRDAPQTFTAKDKEDLDWLIQNNAYVHYDPTLADFVKNNINTEGFQRDTARALRLWVAVGLRQPGLYMDAFLNTALPFLYPYGTYQGTARYIETGMPDNGLTSPFGQPDLVQPRRFAAIRDFLDEHIFGNGADDIPVLRWVFNAGLVIWLMLLCVLYAMYRGDWAHVSMLMLPVLLWGTYLLGPVMQGRYLYPFVCILPVLCAGLGARPARGTDSIIHEEE